MHPYPLMISVVYLLTLKAGTEWVFFKSVTINNFQKIHFISRTTFSQFLLQDQTFLTLFETEEICMSRSLTSFLRVSISRVSLLIVVSYNNEQ